ncbi:DUF7331 family protein [Halomarina oriensis]|uniref:Uncharacterized protein n=1 Tax=Halomarina oriensis TaxID=671145 RepID=A0A6B0GM85_9EURY|nr:hypothetical protein [Halomarina oriensis]MWG35770.1 hypothetical protein [Halomarina oriensis]
MSTRTYDESRTESTTEPDCVALELEDGQVIIYDPEANGAWIQSDVAYPIERTKPQDA